MNWLCTGRYDYQQHYNFKLHFKEVISLKSIYSQNKFTSKPCISKTVQDTLSQNGKPSKEFNPLKPNDPYSGSTAPLTSKRSILYIYSTNIDTEYFKHGIYSPFFLFKKEFVS